MFEKTLMNKISISHNGLKKILIQTNVSSMEKFYTLVTKIDYRISFEEQRKSWYIVYDIIQIIR